MNFLKSALYVTALGGVFLLSSCGDRSVSKEDVAAWDTMLKNAKEEKKDLTAKNVTKYDIAVSNLFSKGWKKFSDPVGKFEVYMPFTPRVVPQTDATLKQWRCDVRLGEEEYLVGYIDLGDMVTTKAGEERVEKKLIDILFEQNNAIKKLNSMGSYYTKVELPNNHVALKAKATSGLKNFQVKALYHKGKAYYSMAFRKTGYSVNALEKMKQEKIIENFFNTFKITESTASM